MTIINKIHQEKQVIDCDSFHIVSDKYPICKNHLLALSNVELTCSLDGNRNNFEKLFEKADQFYSGRYLFFERGNASFCTSFDGPYWAHIHFVPEILFNKGIIDKLKDELSAHLFNITDKKEHYDCEYILFGDSNKIFFKEVDFILPKRFIRTYLQNELLTK